MSSYCRLNHLSSFRLGLLAHPQPHPSRPPVARPEGTPLAAGQGCLQREALHVVPSTWSFLYLTSSSKIYREAQDLERLKGRYGGSWRSCKPSCLPMPARLFCVVESMVYKKKRNFLHQLPLEKFWTTESSYKHFLYSPWKKLFNSGEEQDGGGVGGHGVHLSAQYIRNTPSDTEVHAKHQLRADRSTWPVEKNI